MGRRFSIGTLCTISLVGLGASHASAFAFDMVARTPTTSLAVSDEVVVDIFFDATEVAVQAFRVSVLSSNASVVQYDASASAALPASGNAGPGTQPAYILYDPGIGMSLPAVALYPQQTPTWPTWPSPPVGQEEVNITFQASNVTSPAYTTRTTGTGIWIASLVFHIAAPIQQETLALSMTESSDAFYVSSTVPVPPEQIGLSAPILLGYMPEPTTGLLLGLALVAGVAATGRRRA